MHTTLEKLSRVKNKINEIIYKKQLNTNPKIVVVTKKFPLNNIMPLLENGHTHYGENKIQEAENKWIDTKNRYKDLQLHMIGKLQINKAKKAVKLFDYIHSLDNDKLALKLSYYEKELNKKVKTFVQINIGEESQKNGISPKNVHQFVNYCRDNLSLNIIGLMCLPPINENPEKYFLYLNQLRNKVDLCHLSMGMSSDYQIATKCGSTFLRIGSKILGERNSS